MADLKIAFIDIETAPTRGYVWEMHEAEVLEVDQDWYMLSFAVKWNDGKTKVYSLPDYKGYKKNKTNDRLLVSDLHRVFTDADIVIAHNGDNFDIKRANARFVFHGLTPPPTYKTVDTLKLARRSFRFDSNRLDSLARYLGLGRKLATQGKNTWLGCMNGDMKAWKTMTSYNKHDVELLYEVYMKLRPWARNHPNLGLLMDRPHTCPICGEKNTLHRRGYEFTRAGRKQRFQCKSCGGWSVGKSEKTEIVIR